MAFGYCLSTRKQGRKQGRGSIFAMISREICCFESKKGGGSGCLDTKWKEAFPVKCFGATGKSVTGP